MKNFKWNRNRKKAGIKEENISFFKAMLDNLVFGGLFIDPARNIVYCNQNIEKIFGYSKTAIVGKQTDLLYKDRRESSGKTSEIYNILEKTGFHVGKAQGLTKDEKEINLKLSTFVVRPNSGAIIFVEEIGKHLGLGIDKSLFLQNLLDTIPDMIYFKDMKNRFVLVNKAHAAALGLAPEEVIGKSDLDLFPKEVSIKYYANDVEIIKTGRPVIGKIEKALRPDGGMTYVSTTKLPHYDEKGEIIGTIGITRNITDKMVAEEELHAYKDRLEELVTERTQKLEENNEKLLQMYNIKSEFSSIVSHELRTPLTIMKEGVSLVEDETLGVLNENQKTNLGIVLNNINRLTRLINDILDFSKLESKKMEFRSAKGNINGVLSQVVESYGTSIKKKSLKLKVELNSSLPLVEFDSDRIAQVLYNLIDNAIKFTNEGYISITSTYDDKNVKVSIEDTGCGIKQEDLARVFERFEQVFPDVGTRKGGTGLGLAVSKQIIEQLGGQIFVESEYGKGSKFSFLLPIKS